jgi:hypothetical protein
MNGSMNGTLTVQELDQVRRSHYPIAVGRFDELTVCHAGCFGGAWPCLVIRLLDALDAETARADAAEEWLTEQRGVRKRLLDEVAELKDRLHDAVTVADAAEERLAIQIEANLALHEVIEELEMRLNLTIPEGEEEKVSDG